MEYLLQLAASPTAWVALATLVVMEIVLGIDNLIFISILTNKLPEQHRAKARRIGIGMALILRLALLSTIAFIVQLTEPVIDVFGQSFSWKDMILIAGGLFLVWKATTEIHHSMSPEPEEKDTASNGVSIGFAAAIVQILMLDMVFSIDSIITAVGMTEHLPIMIIAVVASVLVMLLAAEPLAKFINDNPTVVMLALGFLIMIGMTLIAEGFGAHVPKGYVYAAMAFSAAIETLNILARRVRQKRQAVETQAKA
ncbi:hypothetical protein BK634_24460 [Pseudomonas chlororaphis]|jgi:predicted tellurium resistance membrane protein TerC|uniref:TerC family protein n=1 Tax=Pseudomonas morbosilactucae TaxID=2938197 RepID=A0A9X2C556_9PSED|nr:TerC family protein [Pseudomonas morbosilactucae]MCK9797691.1 TerC family protein [Pseudomonas morbosilactucae]MCK9815573.1 TerC family protein [Pseudomonas morbosilactucae]ROL65969.1 hypothetical protein BK634_24460 [Pseudomonas chlororaphis]WEK08245.1 MAG: TerC family protein [Pseudomonas sp.]